jgi:hypothetical protein
MIDTQCRGLVNKLAREFFQIDAWEVPASRVEVMYNNCRERPWITASFTLHVKRSSSPPFLLRDGPVSPLYILLWPKGSSPRKYRFNRIS